ncbi:MAG TPA: HIT family protein [Patescibacteria group bacterium]
MDMLLPPATGSIFYEDKKVIAHLASFPFTAGHSLVVWKEPVSDLHLLGPNEYRHLMTVVDNVRNALRQAYKVEKAYLMYLDEAKHVHWHIVPRYNEQGFSLLTHNPTEITDFSMVPTLSKALTT